MASKSSVSALQEYCAQHKIPAPTYECIDAEDGSSFICRAQIMNMEADGHGRSKRDAKHLAASNLIKRIRQDFPDIDNIRPVEHGEMSTIDMIVTLRDYCVQNDHPLPVFEIVQQGGTPDAPEFTAMCLVASIRRYGVSDKKKDAKQIAAKEIFDVIYEHTKPLDHQMQVASVETKMDDVESERYEKFKTYRELTESHSNTDSPGTFLCDRHNYFTKFHEHLKAEAKKILDSRSYEENYQGQVRDLFQALKIIPRIKKHTADKSLEQMVLVEINCEYDVVFANVGGKVYINILEYFRDMLY